MKVESGLILLSPLEIKGVTAQPYDNITQNNSTKSTFKNQVNGTIQKIPDATLQNFNIEHWKNEIYTKFSDVFEPSIGTIPNVESKYKLREGVTPIYIKARPLPYAIRDLISNEIDRLEKCVILQKVEHSDWGTPIVPVLKSETEIRLCADYKITLNRSIVDDKYAIPKIEDMMRNFKNGVYFCVFDVRKAYLHMKMNEESALMQTISTHKGQYMVKKLMFGVKTAPNIWQKRFMDEYIRNDLT